MPSSARGYPSQGQKLSPRVWWSEHVRANVKLLAAFRDGDVNRPTNGQSAMFVCHCTSNCHAPARLLDRKSPRGGALSLPGRLDRNAAVSHTGEVDSWVDSWVDSRWLIASRTNP